VQELTLKTKKRWYNMKRTTRTRTLVSACMALMIMLGSHAVAFAAVSATEEATQTIVVTAAETSEAASETSGAATTNADGTINASPNTGVPFPPMAAVLLALAAVPVIVVAGRKKITE
jgi:F420-dependent methylenetetrahydromethanopterin dehydrogenase